MFIFDTVHNLSYKYYIKCLLLPFYDILYNILLVIVRPKKTTKRYSVSICSIFKDEAHNLCEWIEFHIIVGVEHFYLYNNFSSDNFQAVLQPYIEKGLITIIDWNVPHGQFSAYEDFYKKYRSETQWVSFLDLDEFICPYYEISVADWIRKYDKYPCVVLYWKMFGTSGIIEHNPEKLTTEQYTVSWAKHDNVGKVLLNTDYDVTHFDGSNLHITYTKVNLLGHSIAIPPINEFHKFIRWNIHRTGLKKPEDFTIQINHYWSKSFNGHIRKISKGAACPNYAHTMEQFWWHEHHNISTDHKIFRFLIELKTAIKPTRPPQN